MKGRTLSEPSEFLGNNNKTAADEFKAAFDAAVQFNSDTKDGKDATEAAEIDDVEDVRGDNIDVNESADKDGE